MIIAIATPELAQIKCEGIFGGSVELFGVLRVSRHGCLLQGYSLVLCVLLGGDVSIESHLLSVGGYGFYETSGSVAAVLLDERLVKVSGDMDERIYGSERQEVGFSLNKVIFNVKRKDGSVSVWVSYERAILSTILRLKVVLEIESTSSLLLKSLISFA